MLFQAIQIGGFQNCAIWVSSAVRVVLLIAPRLLALLVGGRVGLARQARRRCGAELARATNANGRTVGHWVKAGCANAGGVGW